MGDISRQPCPNCGTKTLTIELEENRGVCGLCYEALSDPHNPVWYPQYEATRKALSKEALDSLKKEVTDDK